MENAEEWVLKGIDKLFKQRRVHNLVMEARTRRRRRFAPVALPSAAPRCTTRC